MNSERTPHTTPTWSKRLSLYECRSRKHGHDITGRGRTKDEALDDFATKWRDRFAQDDGLGADVTVGEYWKYLVEVVGLVGKESSQASRKNHVEGYVLPWLGSVPLREVSPKHGERLLKELRSAGFSKQTQSHGLKSAKWLLQQAVRSERLDRNRLEFVQAPKLDDAKRFLSDEEATLLYEASRGHRHEVVVRSLLQLGVRNGELGGLQWHDLNLDDGEVRIRRQLHDVTGTLTKPKYNSTRTLPLTTSLCSLLERHREAQREEERRRPANPRWDGAEFVVVNGRGNPLDKNALGATVRGFADDAGLNDHEDGSVTPQVLRRTCATRLLRDSGDLVRVSRWLGHRDIKQTMAYLDVRDEHLGDLRQVVGKWKV